MNGNTEDVLIKPPQGFKRFLRSVPCAAPAEMPAGIVAEMKAEFIVYQQADIS